MTEWLTPIIAITGLVSSICAIILSLRNIKNTSPSAILKEWQKKTDEKLDNDYHKLNHLERNYERMEELDRLILRSVKGMLTHFSEGNHTNTMKEIIKAIDEFLIER